MGYGTRDGYAPATAKEQFALDVWNLAHSNTGAFAVTWDQLRPADLLEVNAVYARLNGIETPTSTDYYIAAMFLSEKQWNVLTDISRDTETLGRYRAAEHFAPGRATLASLVRKGYILRNADGSYVTSIYGEKVANALD